MVALPGASKLKQVSSNGVIVIVGLIFLAVGLKSSKGLACASCGSSGDDPLILFPNENLKMLVSITQNSGFENIDSKGRSGAAGGPDIKQTFGLSFGKAINHRSFVTLSESIVTNRKDRDSKSSLGDLSLAGRYTLVMQSIDELTIPQIQISYGYKHRLVNGIRDSNDPKLLDVFGTGFSDIRLGVDLWYGLWSFKPGIAVSLVNPLARRINGKLYDPGAILRTTTSLSYLTASNYKFSLGINREYKSSIVIEDSPTTEPQLSHSVFVSCDAPLSAGNTIRLSLSSQGRIFDNYNSSKSDSASVSFIRVF